MKLFLTSAGIHNPTMAKALEELLNMEKKAVKVGFVPTAANVEAGNKGWFIRQMTNLTPYGYEWIDVVDFSTPLCNWEKRLNECNLIVVSGGNVFYLLEMARKFGFDNWLRSVVDEKVFVCISAGSIFATPTCKIALSKYGDENITNTQNFNSMGLVDFEICPHYDGSDDMKEFIRNYAYNEKQTIYAMDDETGIIVNNGEMKVVSEGKWDMFQ